MPCPDCGSKDALSENVDGSTKCFSCGEFHPAPSGSDVAELSDAKDSWAAGFAHGEYQDLVQRGIPQYICERWGYTVGEYGGRKCQIANYRDKEGTLVGQKLRFKDKTFRVIGKVEGLFGMHKFGSGSSKRITVTEGEIDCLSVATVMQGKWPVVSIPSGAQAAVKVFKKYSDYLESFDEVIVMFDNDEAGLLAAKSCASVLSVGKVKIANLELKDPNEYLKAGRGTELISAFWNAQPYRPDGIVRGDEMWELLSDTTKVPSVPYPFVGLNNLTYGIRTGEIVTFTAGSGVGKSSVCREIAYSLLMREEKIGYIALEESIKRTGQGIMGIHLNIPLHIGNNNVSTDQLRKAYEATVGSGNYATYDHWGSIDSDNLINRIRYMNKALDCKYVFLDHVSIVVSGQDGDERKMIDILMTKLRSLVEEVDIGLILVSHLKRPDGRGFEEGRQITLGDLRGSAGLGQLSDIVIGVERNQQDEENKNRSTVRVLKNRFSGETGLACFLDYNKQTGRLTEDISLNPITESPFENVQGKEQEPKVFEVAETSANDTVAPY